jgi:hypothetical protein
MALEELVTAPRSPLAALAPTEEGTEYASNGIGLSICRKSLNGKLWIEAQETRA